MEVKFSDTCDEKETLLVSLQPQVCAALGLDGSEAHGTSGVAICGCASDEAILVTEDRSYLMKNVSTSDLLLLCPCELLPSSKEASVESVITGWQEIVPTPPRLGVLDSLLASRLLTEKIEHIEGFGFLFKELESLVQASPLEILTALRGLNAIEIDGRWGLLSEDFLFSMVDVILSGVIEQGWPLARIHLSSIIHLLGQEDGLSKARFFKEVGEHVLRSVSKASRTVESDSPSPDEVPDVIFDLDRDKAAIFRAQQLLSLTRRPFAWVEFEHAWQETTPGWRDSPPPVRLLRGIALLDRKSGLRGGKVTYFPESELSRNVAKRFVHLFAIRDTWTKEDIEPYLASIASIEQTTVDSLLLKYARSISSNDGTSDRVYVARD